MTSQGGRQWRIRPEVWKWRKEGSDLVWILDIYIAAQVIFNVSLFLFLVRLTIIQLLGSDSDFTYTSFTQCNSMDFSGVTPDFTNGIRISGPCCLNILTLHGSQIRLFLRINSLHTMIHLASGQGGWCTLSHSVRSPVHLPKTSAWKMKLTAAWKEDANLRKTGKAGKHQNTYKVSKENKDKFFHKNLLPRL